MERPVRPDGRHAGQALNRSDTIFAVATGAPPAAIAIVRISGSAADAALRALTAGALPDPRTAVVRELRDRGDLLDRALVLRFDPPRTATGEAVVELHLHGGRATIAAVLAALTRQPGLRAAEPGEFTRRALGNGVLDLTQAEALGELLQAETEVQRRAALAVAEGGLARLLATWRDRLIKLSARAEAAIEFGDEDDVLPFADGAARIAELRDELMDLLARPAAERLRDGFRVAIAGPPNAGKSSLLNALAGRPVALASPLAGTTRDRIEAPVQLGGIPFLLTDTAGLRGDSDDPIETLGIALAAQTIAESDLVLWLGVPDERPAHPNVQLLVAKCDIELRDDGLRVSSHSGEGLATLHGLLIEEGQRLFGHGDRLLANQRQRDALAQAAAELEHPSSDAVLLAEQLRLARLALDSVTGQGGAEDVMNAIFSTFCIGK